MHVRMCIYIHKNVHALTAVRTNCLLLFHSDTHSATATPVTSSRATLHPTPCVFAWGSSFCADYSQDGRLPSRAEATATAIYSTVPAAVAAEGREGCVAA